MTDEAKVEQEQETPAAPAEAPVVDSADADQKTPAKKSKKKNLQEELKDAEEKVEELEKDVKEDAKKVKGALKHLEEEIEEVYDRSKKWFLEQFKKEDEAAAAQPSADKKEGE